jgi:heme/copper-type cytochrome/quinol oxidase subunit 2
MELRKVYEKCKNYIPSLTPVQKAIKKAIRKVIRYTISIFIAIILIVIFCFLEFLWFELFGTM